MYIKPKKSLGQNFLIDKNVQRKIVDACEFKPCDIVLEIGAGRGELTRLIVPRVAFVFALEIDSYLCNALADTLRGYSNVKIINQDILKLNLKRYFSNLKKKIKVVGNIPYYITTPIFEHFLKLRSKIDTLFITVQREFGRRITAQPGSKDYGSLSCFTQYYTLPKILFYIKRASFLPAPKVDSCFLRFDMRQKTILSKKQEKLLFTIIRAAFNKRRKILRNSLRGIIPQSKLNTFFDKYGIDPNIRPEDLTLEDFVNLTNL